jgi:hypothetical protein
MSSSSEQSFKTKLDKAVAGHYYIHVFRKDGKLKTSHIKLSGYSQMFVKDPEFMYVFSLRHAGKFQDLLEYMTSLNFAETDVRTYLKDAYTASNYTSLVADINAELSSIPSVKKEPKREVSLSEIINLKPLLDGVRSGKAIVAAEEMPVPSTPKNTRSKTDLKSRLDALEEDKVLDITSFDVAKGTGIKTGKRTVKGTRRPLAATGDLNRVVFDFDKSADVAIAALQAMGMTETAAKAALSNVQSSKVSSLSKIAISPRLAK